LAAAFSLISIIFSVTRTSLLLIAISVLLILIQNTSFANKYWKLITISMPALLLAFPLVSVLVGNLNGNQDMGTLNGRTFLWNCVTSKWDQFVPFGVGVQGAFPQGFCSDDEWFSKLRHPENMFLLNFVESGILGIVGLVLLFVITFWFSGKALKRGSGLPMAITSTFLLSSIFYVPLFHYLPFLENRTADRGVFNFFLFTLLWMAVLKLFNSETTKQKAKTS
jgi:O-antigen ligase